MDKLKLEELKKTCEIIKKYDNQEDRIRNIIGVYQETLIDNLGLNHNIEIKTGDTLKNIFSGLKTIEETINNEKLQILKMKESNTIINIKLINELKELEKQLEFYRENVGKIVSIISNSSNTDKDTSEINQLMIKITEEYNKEVEIIIESKKDLNIMEISTLKEIQKFHLN